MKNYLAKLAADYEKIDEADSYKMAEGLKKVTGKFIPGSRCAWCFNEDLELWNKQGLPVPYPSRWPYSGFIIPFPNTDGRDEMELEHICLVIVDYPIEKENPETDWCTLASLFDRAELLHFFIFP